MVIGAGAGLSTSAGFAYTGERFQKYFSDFISRYHFADMYSGGFYPFDSLEEHWAYWSRYIYINRFMDAPKPVYRDLLKLAAGRDYFVLTTNVDHQFQKAGFDKQRLFYTQGDYGLWQCSKPCHQKTYDNEEIVRRMVEAQGFVIGPDGALELPEGTTLRMTVPRRYEAFLRRHEGEHILFLELGVGGNTPVIIKYPFWRMTYQNPRAVYACVNLSEAYCPREIRARSICVEGDVGTVLHRLL